MVVNKTVFFTRNFKLPDGTLHDTWFIIVSGGTLDTPCICLKSTSQDDRYFPANHGCNHRKYNSCFYIDKEWQKCFTKNSYIILPELIEVSISKILELRNNRGLVQKGYITDDCFQQLLLCLIGFEDDIAVDHYKRLIKEVIL